MSPSSNWSSRLLLFALLAVLPPQVLADEAADQAAKLAGKNAKEWVFKKWEIFLGPGNRCKAGQSYRFKADHSLVISNCVDGQIHTETEEWSIESATPLETHLKAGNTSYILKFWDDAKGHFMMLRKMGQAQTDVTRDKIFQFAED